MKHLATTTLLLTCLGSFTPISSIYAADAANPSPHSVTGNFSLVSDYRFRGISQTYKYPAVQGGIDYAHTSGFYIGTWASNISGNSYPDGASLEIDLYSGKKFAVAQDTVLDIGLLQYYYPGAKWNSIANNTSGRQTKFNNLEAYVGASYKWLSAKYSYTLSNYFGMNKDTLGGACELAKTGGDPTNCFTADPGNSRGSGYFDLSAAYPLNDKLTLNAHIGHQTVRHYNKLNYSDWKLGINYDLNGWSLGANYIDSNANKGFWYACEGGDSSRSCKKTGTGTFVLSVSKTF